MSETLFPPFLKWGDYQSKDADNPDVLTVEPLEDETFETEYSVNIKANVDGNDKIIPLHSFESPNKQLIQKWTRAMQQDKIQVGKKIKILTWLGTSKNNRPIRRFEIVT